DDGWLNTIFRAEFGLWFGMVLPSFTEVGYPVPLGGTTCFFRRSALVATGVKREEQFGDPWEKEDELWARREGLFGRRPWSTENVTEDFELGLFLWKDEQSVGYLDSTTSVESPIRLDNWVRQRTRWEKGKLYTLLQHRNGPDSGYLGRMHTTLQAGLPLLGPVNIFGVVFLFMIANAAGYDPGGWLGVLLSVGLAFVISVSAFYGLGYWLASGKGFWTRLRRLGTVVLTAPVYWLLQWGAAIRAIWQVYNGLLHWERTNHNGRNGGGEAAAVERREPSSVELTSGHRLVVLAGILLGGIAIRAYDLGGMALWNDEISTIAARASAPLADLLVANGSLHPPLYFLLVRGWMVVFGSGAVSVRALSLGISVGTIGAVYLLGRELFDENAGLVAAALIALSSFHVHFARTARMYELLGVLSLLSWFAFLRLQTGSREATGGYLLATAAMVYTHLAGLLVLLA
ncbi:MAG: glycosyltransferase family 2 protein, partial [Halodesulfurarchaeum sp.]